MEMNYFYQHNSKQFMNDEKCVCVCVSLTEFIRFISDL